MFKVNNKDIKTTSMRFYQKFSIFGPCYTSPQEFMTDDDFFLKDKHNQVNFKNCSGWFPCVTTFSEIFDKSVSKEHGKDIELFI